MKLRKVQKMDKYNICGIPHTIIEKEVIEGNGSGTILGQITYCDCIIEMRKNLTPEMYRQTLIHEIVHGMLTMIGRNELSEDETFVQSLALAISQTFDLKGSDDER